MPDYTQPGDDGGQGPASIDWTIEDERPLPDPINCGKWYAITSRAQQQVEQCAGMNYRPLFERAHQLGARLLDQHPCPNGCPTRHSLLEARWWNCRAHVAYAVARFALLCDNANPMLPPPLTPAPYPTSDDELRRRELEDLPRVDFEVEETIREIYVAGADIGSWLLNCPDQKTMRYVYRQRVQTCPPATFEPFVDAAVKQVEHYSQTFHCADQCQLKLEVLRKQWFCFRRNHRDTVEVNVYFRVSCEEARPDHG